MTPASPEPPGGGSTDDAPEVPADPVRGARAEDTRQTLRDDAQEIRPPDAARLPLRWVVGFYGALLAVAWLWRHAVDGVAPLRAPGAGPDALAAWPLQLAIGLAVGIALAWGSRAWTARSAAGARLAAELARLLGPVSPSRALLLALASGIAEEAFFRGALQPRVGLVAASVLFGLAHWGPTPGLRPWTLYAGLVGFGLGALFVLTGTLVAPAAAHVATNALNLRWLARDAAPSATRDAAGGAGPPAPP